MHQPHFYFDFISPFAYLAWTRLPAIESECQVHIEPVPVLFAGLLNAHGQLGPAEIPAKARWVYRHVARQANRHGIEINPPVHHPFNPLIALRVVSLPLPGEQRNQLIDALFRAVWVEARHVAEPEVVMAVADSVGLDGMVLVDAANTPKNKELLRRHTEQAIADGIFGVPTVRAGNEVFWGFDDLQNLIEYLKGNDPISGQLWGELPEPSATRR
jgi:2-hydroxychromene-2-carboxylate isomerase